MVDEVAVTAGNVKCVFLWSFSVLPLCCRPSYSCIVDPGGYLIQLLTRHGVA